MHSTVPSSFSVSRKGIISLLVLSLFLMSLGFVNTTSVTAQDDCVIPDSGPWPSCATAGDAPPADVADDCVIPPSGPWPPCASGGDSGGTTPDPEPEACVIPESGPWPPCATGGGSGATPPAPDPTPGECVIPESGPWPPCATGGGTAPAPGTPDPAPAPDECIIPPSGPWPPCATDGSGTTPPPAPGPDPDPGTSPTPPDNLPPRAPGASETAPRPSEPGSPATSSTVIQVTNDVAVSGAKRLGLNVGARNQFGAAQLLKNIIPNPGFEGGQFTMVIHVLPGASGDRIQSDNWQTEWNNDVIQIGHLPSFWNGADFEVMTGAAKGRKGKVESFTHEDGRYTFNLAGGGVAPGQDDIVTFRQYNVPGYELDAQQFAKAAAEDKRPGSPGQQALRLLPAGSFVPSWKMGFDSFARDEDNGAGKLMVVEGPWHFEIWARSETGGGTLDVSFRRLNEAEFIKESFPLTTSWEKFTVDFNVAKGLDAQIEGVPQPLTLEFTVSGNTLIDDVALHQSDHTNSTVFSDTYVQRLKEMRPGILRNWGTQPGSSLNNMLSSEYARRTTGSSPEQRLPRNFMYSLPEFLALCQAVNADPWIVLPATLSDAELLQFMDYMGRNWSQFSKIYVEYGNEVWGANFGADPFLGQTFRGGERAGIVSGDRIAVMKSSPSYSGKFQFVIGGQSRFAGRQTEIEDNSDSHDSIGFAPYYGELQDAGSDPSRYMPLYAHATELSQRGTMVENKAILDANGTDMSIYEINLHTIRNFVNQDVRNDTLSSQGAGISLPLVMLSYMRDMGITDQAVFQSAQFSEPAPGGFASLFGVLRDIEATGRKRPTGLGLEMANKAIGGEMLNVNTSGSPSFSVPGGNGMVASTTAQSVQAFAFKQGGRYSIVLFNLDLQSAHQATLQVPSAPGGAQMWMLGADDIHADNEVNKDVDIFTMPIKMGQQTNINLAPHSMYVITWNG